MDQFETDFVSTLTYDLQNIDRNNKGIPREWFEEFYQLAHSCTISGAIKPINAGRPECVPGQKISAEAINQDEYVMNTAAASYAVIAGLRRYLNRQGFAGTSFTNSSVRTQIR